MALRGVCAGRSSLRTWRAAAEVSRRTLSNVEFGAQGQAHALTASSATRIACGILQGRGRPSSFLEGLRNHQCR